MASGLKSTFSSRDSSVHVLQHLNLLLQRKALKLFSPVVGPLVFILYTIMVVTKKYLKSTIS